MKSPFSFFIFFSLFLILSCNTTKKTADVPSDEEAMKEAVDKNLDKKREKRKNTQKSQDGDLSLRAILRRTPGLIVSSRGVQIQGMNQSLTSSNTPLFYVNETRVGHSLSQVEGMVNPNDIEEVEVLRSPSELSFYGSAGSAGVIIVRTKQ